MDYIRSLGFNLIIMWEHEWNKSEMDDVQVNNFAKLHKKNQLFPFCKTKSHIISKVQSGEFFGMVECDIEVPTDLREYFSEMTPIFKNVKVPRSEIGPFMEKFAVDNKIMSQPRRMLIGSYFGKKILLATPLLKFYLEKGLVVTNIYQAIAYRPNACFGAFRDLVSDARRQGDLHPNKAIIAECMKLIGNSCYGKLLTNLNNHRNVKYCNTESVHHYVRDSCFRSLEQLGDDLFEIEMSKNTIRQKLPIHIGYFVYAYSKLLMLQWYYDFLDKYCDRSDFQYIQMDTDSAYCALSGETLDAIVKPCMRREFYENWDSWIPAVACDDHKIDFVATKMRGRHGSLRVNVVWIGHDMTRGNLG
jgi:hypothetical protein